MVVSILLVPKRKIHFILQEKVLSLRFSQDTHLLKEAALWMGEGLRCESPISILEKLMRKTFSTCLAMILSTVRNFTEMRRLMSCLNLTYQIGARAFEGSAWVLKFPFGTKKKVYRNLSLAVIFMISILWEPLLKRRRKVPTHLMRFMIEHLQPEIILSFHSLK